MSSKIVLTVMSLLCDLLLEYGVNNEFSTLFCLYANNTVRRFMCTQVMLVGFDTAYLG